MNRFGVIVITGLVVSSFCFFIPGIANAQQTDNGALSGTVTDPNKQIVPAATVTATSFATGLKRTATTGSDGRWSIVALPLGDYAVKAEAGAFKPVVQKATVTASSTVRVDLMLG